MGKPEPYQVKLFSTEKLELILHTPGISLYKATTERAVNVLEMKVVLMF